MIEPFRRYFSMLGPPASGKGTQGRRLAEKYGVPYFSSGASLRQEVASGSEMGKRVESYLSRNAYIPDSLALEFVGSWVNKHRDGWVLDGFPRSLEQARYLAEELELDFLGIHLEVPFEVLVSRVEHRRECLRCALTLKSDQEVCPKCGEKTEVREDDSDEGLKSRYDEYCANTLPVLDYLRSREQVIEVDGVGSVDEIWGRIENKLG